MSHFKPLLLAVLPLTMMLSGCGDMIDPGDHRVSPPGTYGRSTAGINYAGVSVCMDCHNSANFLWSNALVGDYLSSKHAVHSTHIDASATNRSAGCLECHDPVGDGGSLAALIPAANVPAAGLAAVTCEACHGAGGNHFGVGPLPEAAPGATVCGQCHKALPGDHLVYHPEANRILQDYQLSQHATGAVRNDEMCAKCHSDAGAWLYRNVTTTLGLETVAAVPSAAPIQCRTCHNPHDPGQLLKGATAGASAEYNTCTNCHMGNTPIFHQTVAERLLVDSHYDNPATTTVLEGYVVKAGDDRACRDCHNVHSANLTIQRQWARSAHGGFIADTKDAAGDVATKAAAGVTDSTAPAWVHYNWDNNSGNPATDPDPDRSACQRCHTATGAKNFLTAAATLVDADLTNNVIYNPANNDFSHLSGWSTSNRTSPQNEMLYCWGCHKNNSGTLRDPGPFTATYSTRKLDGTLAVAQFPNVAGSNLCITCHSGLESGESVVALTTAANPFTNAGFKNSHYMAAAGLMYVKIGYTNFIDPATPIGTSTYGKSLTASDDGGALSSTHRRLGTPAINGDSHNPSFFVPGNLDTNGPCVVCHLPGKDHTLSIGANAFNAVCVNCHDEEAGTPLTAGNFKTLFIEEQAVPFQNALALAQARLAMAPYSMEYDAAVYPYFFPVGAAHIRANGVSDWTRGGLLTAAEAEKLMGACFNINVLSRDPAAYVHARTYARRLLYDTIDWLDDKTINMSTVTTAVAWDPVKYVKDATAGGTTTESTKYLAKYNRTTLAWDPSERP